MRQIYHLAPARDEGYVLAALSAASEVIAEASDVARLSEVVRGLTAIQKTIDLVEAAKETKRAAVEMLLVAYRCLGKALRAEYGRATPKEISTQTGLRRGDVQHSLNACDYSDSTFDAAIELMRTRSKWPGWQSFVDACKEVTDPEAWRRYLEQRDQNVRLSRFSSVTSVAEARVEEATSRCADCARACGSIENSMKLALSKSEEIKTARLLIAAAGTLARGIADQVDTRGALARALSTVEQLSPFVEDLRRETRKLDDDGYSYLDDIVRPLLRELRSLERSLEGLLVR